MNEPNPFDEIMDAYEVTLDCLKIAKRTIKRNEQNTSAPENTKSTTLTAQ